MTTQRSVTALALAALLTPILPCALACERAPRNDDAATVADDAPLAAVQGRVTSALESAPSSDGLRAYLIWIGENEFADQGGLSSNTAGASFQLDVLEEPATGLFSSDYPDLAIAAVFVMNEATAEIMRGASQGGDGSVPAGTVYGMAQHWVVFSASDDAGAGLVPGTTAGFSLIGPDEDAIACQNEAYVAFDACLSERNECEEIISDEELAEGAYDAYDACIAAAPTCDDEIETIDACGPASKVVPMDTIIDVELQVVSAAVEE